MQMSLLAAQKVTLAWDPSASANILGYKIYYGTTSHKYSSTVSVGNVTQATIAGLIEGTTYFFAITAYDNSNQESDFSNEASYAVPVNATNQASTSTKLPIVNTLVVGQNLTVSLTTTGTGPMNYQWKYNSVNIASATNAVLTLSKVAANQAGTFDVIVSNASGLTNVIAVNLTVYATAAPTLTQAGYANGQYSFDVAGVPGYSYVVQASTNLVDWVCVQTNAAPFTFVDSQANQFNQRFYRTIYPGDSTSSITVNSTVYAAATATLKQAGYVKGQYSFNVIGVPGYSYVVQASTNLVDWVCVQTNAAPFTFVDSQAGQFNQRFYRTIYPGDSTSSITVNSTAYTTATATLTQAGYANGQYSFNVAGVPGYSYVVQASTNLVDWICVQTNAAPFTFVDSQANQFNQRFYRTF